MMHVLAYLVDLVRHITVVISVHEFSKWLER